MDSPWFWAVLGLLLGLDLLFAALRSSLVNARQAQLLDLRPLQPRRVDRTLALLQRPHLRATLRLLLAGVHLLLGVQVGFALATLLRFETADWLPWLVGGGVLLGVFGVAVCEFGVERFVLRSPERAALHLTGLAIGLDGLLRPLTQILMAILGMPMQLERGASGVTEDGLKDWVEQDAPQGGLEKEERQMIYSIFQFGDTICREIMVPRMDVMALNVDAPLSEAVRTVIQSGHSRLPVYEDAIDNVLGLLYAKDLLKAQLQGEPTTGLRSLLRPAFFVPESKKVDDLLREMQARRFHMAVVVDEYGGMAGLVTMEDIVEEIVGEIRDEYDQSEELFCQQVGTDEFLLHGRLDVEDVNAALDVHLTRELSDTLGGYIYSQIGRVPIEGEQLLLEGWLLTMEVVTERRIRQVRAARKPNNDVEKEEGDSHADG